MKPEFEAPALAKGNILHKYYAGLCDPNASPESIKLIVSDFTKRFPTEFMKYSRKWKAHAKALPPGPAILVEKEMRMDIPIPEPLVEPSTGKRYSSVVFKGFIDYMNMNAPGLAYVIDFKSGRASTAPKYADQLAIYAAMVFSTYSQVQTVRSYTYDISDNMNSEVSEQNSFEFTRKADYENLMETLSKIIWSLIDSALKGKFAATPCMRCGYCPDYACKFNRTPQHKRGITGTAPEPPTRTFEEVPKETPTARAVVSTEYDDTYGPPVLDEPEPPIVEPETVPTESVTKIGDKERNLLMDLKKKLEKSKSQD